MMKIINKGVKNTIGKIALWNDKVQVNQAENRVA